MFSTEQAINVIPHVSLQTALVSQETSLAAPTWHRRSGMEYGEYMLFTLVRLRRRLSVDSGIPYTYTQAKTASETQCDLSWDTTEYDFHWFPVPRLGWFGLQQRPWRDGSACVDGGLGISDEWCGHCLTQRVTMSSILAKVNTHWNHLKCQTSTSLY